MNVRMGLTIVAGAGAALTLFSLLGTRTQASELLLSLWGMMTVPAIVLAFICLAVRAYAASGLALVPVIIMLMGTWPHLSKGSVVSDPAHQVIWSNVQENPDAVEATLSYAEDIGASLVLIAEWPEQDVPPPSDEWRLVSHSCAGQPVSALARSISVTCTRPSSDRRGSVVVNFPGRELTLIATHAVAPFVKDGIEGRRDNIQDTVHLTEVDVPAVIVGDLNAVPWSPALNVMRQQGFARAAIGAQATWLGRNHWTGLAIDHAFGRNADLEVQVGPSTGSDHHPILIRIKPIPDA